MRSKTVFVDWDGSDVGYMEVVVVEIQIVVVYVETHSEVVAVVETHREGAVAVVEVLVQFRMLVGSLVDDGRVLKYLWVLKLVVREIW